MWVELQGSGSGWSIIGAKSAKIDGKNGPLAFGWTIEGLEVGDIIAKRGDS